MGRKRGVLVGIAVWTGLAGAWALGDSATVSLLIQQARREAHACLQRGEPGTAVRVLERQLPHINGDAAYLELLAQAYDQYLAELHRLGRMDLVATYLERLAILNPARARELRQKWQLSEPTQKSPRIVACGRLDDELGRGSLPSNESWCLLAEETFLRGQYSQARLYYWRAAQSRQSLSSLQQQRWAYCSWHDIAQLLQSSNASPCNWWVALLEARAARQRSPDWPFAHHIFQEVERRHSSDLLPIRHLPQPQNGWYVSESPHFRIYHHNASLAEQVLRLTELVHAVNAWFWFGELVPPVWDSPAEIYLHPDGDSFHKATGVSPSIPGFSTLRYESADAQRVLSRRMDFRADAPDLLSRLVPHESTHVSLAGRFGPRPLPRWADEGLALLAEPEPLRQHYRQKALAAFQRAQGLPIEKLLTLEEYPATFDPEVFYGQSALLVEWLVRQRGPWTFVQFLSQGRLLGWEPALRRYYGLQSLQDLNAHLRDLLSLPSDQPIPITLPLAPTPHFHAATQLHVAGWKH
ncbi:hypothetical protein HRbin36_00405 [bacterium HR36]|nr:hypothetical protein HRbin36_00405 [bacterium HR36]